MRDHFKEIVKKGDRVVVLFVEIMFSISDDVSGHNPSIIGFIHHAAGVIEGWGLGIEVEILRADRDYLDVFHRTIERPVKIMEHKGMKYGFGCGSSRCAVRRDLKLKPIEQFIRSLGDDYVSYVGIAADETDRLRSMHKEPHKVSLLEKYGINEAQAMQMCGQEGLLSPQYAMEREDGRKMKRDGCWFCPEMKNCEAAAIKHHPEERYRNAWKQFVALEEEDGLAFAKWNTYRKETLHEIDMQI